MVHLFYTRMFFIARYWYQLTQWVTGILFPTMRVAPALAPSYIAQRLSWGSAYKLDPLNGVLDAFTHPAVVQKRISTSKKVGDCDDHAGYWVSCLLRSGLARKAWLGFVWYTGHDGKSAGHAIALWEDFDGQRWWADYGRPVAFESKAGWVPSVVLGRPETEEVDARKGYGTKPLVYATLEVLGTEGEGKLLFGRAEGHSWAM